MGNDLWQTDLFSLLPMPWTLHTYGLAIAIGFLLGVQLSREQATREGLDGEQMVDVTFYVLLCGLIGGRVMYMATDLLHYLQRPLDIFKLWEGGLVWYGGFFGAVFYLWQSAKKTGVPMWQTLDILIVPTALAHAYGRLGCLASGCCFGSPTGLPWGIVFPRFSFAHAEQVSSHLVSSSASPLPVHPTQLYEASAELLLFALLVWWRARKRYHGQLFLLWLSIYPVVRSLIECFRGDRLRGVWFFSTSQYISCLASLLALALYVHWRREARRLRQV